MYEIFFLEIVSDSHKKNTTDHSVQKMTLMLHSALT